MYFLFNIAIINYNPRQGNLVCAYYTPTKILHVEHNRKAKDGSSLAIILEDNKIFIILSGNLIIMKNFNFSLNLLLEISPNSQIRTINFKLDDTIFVAYSDGSIIKAKITENIQVNLGKENSLSEKYQTPEDEFAKIKSIYSTDNMTASFKVNANNNFTKNTDNSTEFLLVSKRYKVLFGVSKYETKNQIIRIYCLRNNNLLRNFTVVEGHILCAKIIDKRELLIIIKYTVDKKFTVLEIYDYKDGRCPTSIYYLNHLLPYSFTVKSMNIANMPSKYYGRNSNHGLLDGDIISLGTTKGDIIFGKILNLYSTNKAGFLPMHIYGLKNVVKEGEEISNNFEVSFIFFDLFFDTLIIGDVSSNIRLFEKLLQIGKSLEEKTALPFFSIFYEMENLPKTIGTRDYNPDLPYFSTYHDVLKDKNLILYDKGSELNFKNEEDLDYVEEINN